MMFGSFRELLRGWHGLESRLFGSRDQEVPEQIELSPLSQPLTREDVTVEINIYRWTGEDEWTLEISGGRDDAVIWTVPFATDELALAAALVAIDKEGVASFASNTLSVLR
ncbi:MAG: hypothetical protein AAF346_11225 [Pseudomonadota bacterium]